MSKERTALLRTTSFSVEAPGDAGLSVAGLTLRRLAVDRFGREACASLSSAGLRLCGGAGSIER
jgi:hypothetical protein